MKTTVPLTFIYVTSLLLSAEAELAPAHGEVIMGNLPQSNDIGMTSYSAGDSGSKGMGFTMTARQDFLLDSVTLRLLTSAGADPDILIMDSVAGNPQHVLATLVNPVFSFATQDYAFTPAAPFVLEAGRSYWIVARNHNSPVQITWFGSVPFLTPTGPAATHVGARVNYSGFPPNQATDLLNSYQVTATPVPEPGTCLLLLLGTAGLAGSGRKRRANEEQRRDQE